MIARPATCDNVRRPGSVSSPAIFSVVDRDPIPMSDIGQGWTMYATTRSHGIDWRWSEPLDYRCLESAECR